ncbi:MAG: hypothetical protein A2144_00840 [Chloroflexi bacterium RBG_16_50_9]|nr:MAG: hypothetical protein A2144_00840 [Chloroflexi bacterium RBG_16_50_9]
MLSNRKRLVAISIAALVLITVMMPFLSACAAKPAPPPTPASAPPPTVSPGLPNVVVFLSLGVGSTRYVQASAFRAAVEKLTPMTMRIEGAERMIERMAPITRGEAHFTLLGPNDVMDWAQGTGPAELLGPQPVRYVWRGFPSIGALIVRGDSGIKTVADLRGKRVPFTPGDPVWNTVNDAVLAFGGLTRDDVQNVTMPGIAAAMGGILAGTVDTAWATNFTTAAVELASSVHGIHWLEMPASDTKGWERAWAVNPYPYPFRITSAAGLKEGESFEGEAGGLLGIQSDANVSTDVVYTFVKALYEGYDVYSPMHKDLANWTFEQAYDLQYMLPIPYHDGTVKLFKEMGVWSPAHEEHQVKTLAAEKERIAGAK